MNPAILVCVCAGGNNHTMSDKSRRIVTTIETHEIWTVRRPSPASLGVPCSQCSSWVEMLTLQEAGQRAGVSQRTVYQWVDEGRIHFSETSDGELFVCLASFFAGIG